MKKVCIGYRYVSYVSKKTGELVEGFELYCVSPMSDKEQVAKGFKWLVQKDKPTKPLWISVNRFNALCSDAGGDICNKTIEVFYNEFGSLAAIQVCE